MNFSKKNHKLVRQNEKNVKKSQKHDVNLQKNSTLYFQVGLILCLLATYFLMDMKFLTSEVNFRDNGGDDYIAESYNLDYKIYKEPVKKEESKIKVKRKKVSLTNKIKQVKNNVKIIDPKRQLVTPEQNTTNVKMNPNSKKSVPVNKARDYNLVQQVPIFPGCEGLSTNEERKVCMSKKISRLVQRRFDTSVGDKIGLSGKQRFHVQFKIDQTGNVTEIKTNAKHNELENEAKRVIGKLPKMEPGKQQNENVAVIYNLPIVFHVIN